MRGRKKVISLCLGLLLVAANSLVIQGQVQLPGPESSIDGETVILFTGDIRGRAKTSDDGSTMGFSMVSALKKSYISAGANVLLLDGGSAVYGLPFANLTEGESVVTLMNTAGYDAMVLGEGELQYGSERLLQLKEKMSFPLLGGNLVQKSNQLSLLSPSTVIEKNGVRYGIIGMVSQDVLRGTDTDHVSDFQVKDYISETKKEVTAIRQYQPDYIIILTHMEVENKNGDNCVNLAKQVPGIDIIISGHNETVLEQGRMEGDTLIVSSDRDLNQVGIVHIKKNGDREAGLITKKQFMRRDFYLDTVTDQIEEEQNTLLSQVVADNKNELKRSGELQFGGETALGNLVTDWMREKTDASVALLPSRTFQADLPSGDITRKHWWDMFPQGTFMAVYQVTGQDIKDAMEASVADSISGGAKSLQVSGIKVAFDPQRQPGDQVLEILVDGKKIALTGGYRVAVPEGFFPGTPVRKFGTLDHLAYEYGKISTQLSPQVEGRMISTTKEAIN